MENVLSRIRVCMWKVLKRIEEYDEDIVVGGTQNRL
jgi:hypothetical protein